MRWEADGPIPGSFFDLLGVRDGSELCRDGELLDFHTLGRLLVDRWVSAYLDPDRADRGRVASRHAAMFVGLHIVEQPVLLRQIDASLRQGRLWIRDGLSAPGPDAEAQGLIELLREEVRTRLWIEFHPQYRAAVMADGHGLAYRKAMAEFAERVETEIDRLSNPITGSLTDRRTSSWSWWWRRLDGDETLRPSLSSGLPARTRLGDLAQDPFTAAHTLLTVARSAALPGIPADPVDLVAAVVTAEGWAAACNEWDWSQAALYGADAARVLGAAIARSAGLRPIAKSPISAHRFWFRPRLPAWALDEAEQCAAWASAHLAGDDLRHAVLAASVDLAEGAEGRVPPAVGSRMVSLSRGLSAFA